MREIGWESMAHLDDLQRAIRNWAAEDADFPLLLNAFEVNAELLDGLLQEREAQGLTQRDVAKRMGTSQSAVDRIESGDVDPRLSTVQRLAVAIGRIIEWRLVNPYEVNSPFSSVQGNVISSRDVDSRRTYPGLWNDGYASAVAHPTPATTILEQPRKEYVGLSGSSSEGKPSRGAQTDAG